MQTHYSTLPANPEHHDGYQVPFFEDRVEEPPFVYLGSKHPPDIATEIPGHVFNFEQAWMEATPVKIHQLIGSPKFPNEKDIDDALLEKELAGIMKLMQSHNINLEIPADKNNRDVYRFITEFLFDREVDDLKLGGLGRHFFYRDDFRN